MSTDESVAYQILPDSEDDSVVLSVPVSPHQHPEAEKRRRHMMLYRAALRGDCKYKVHPDDIAAKISEKGHTVLHIGAMGKSSKFARELLPNVPSDPSPSPVPKPHNPNLGLDTKLERLDDLVRRNNAGNTAFCLAAACGKLELAKKMLEVAKEMVKEKKYENLKDAMIKENEYGDSEEVEMMERNGEYLAQVKGNAKTSPLLFAVLWGHEEMVYWLYYLTKDSLSDDDRMELLLLLIKNGFHDLAQQLLEKHKALATAHDKTKEKETALHALAQFPVANQQGVWKRIKKCFNRYHTLQLLEKYKELANQQGIWEKIKKCFNRFLCSIEKQSPEKKLIQLVWELAMDSHDFESNILKVAEKQIFVAAERGNVEFLKILIHGYPDLIFKKDDNGLSIFHSAVQYRHEDIFRLIHEIGSVKDLIVSYTDNNNGNNMLHLAGMLAPSERLHSVSGVALQMQRELLWFEEVKKLLKQSDAEAKNNGKSPDENSVDAEANKGGKGSAAETKSKDEKTPRALFIEKHEKLKEEGEKWMKDTANYCMVVAALITLIVVAAALAVPGGTSDETGTPHFLKKSSFKVFIVSDAISLVLSACSVVTFLSILTSRYAEEDFLEPLPRKLLLGLGTLLLSIAAMMVAYSAAIFILFKNGVLWIPILVAAIGSLPVIFFFIQQLRLFFDVFCSIYCSSSIFNPGKGTLFLENGKAMKY